MQKTLKILINWATQRTCGLDFYHSLADGETKTQKGWMPYWRAQRRPVAELETKQLEPRYTSIWCCTLLLCIISQVFLSSFGPQFLSNSKVFYFYSLPSSKPFCYLLSVDNTLPITQPWVILLTLDSHFLWKTWLLTLDSNFLWKTWR